MFVLYIGGEDFTSSVSSVTLQVGEPAVCSHLTLNPDSLVEGNESFFLAFTNKDIILNGGLGLQVLIVIDDSTGMWPMCFCFFFLCISKISLQLWK